MPDTATDLVPVIRSGDFAKLREELVQQRPPELAEALADLQAEDQVSSPSGFCRAGWLRPSSSTWLQSRNGP